MDRKQGWLWMLAGVLLALLAAFMVYRLLSTTVQVAAQTEEVDTKPVVVAAVDVPMRTVLDETMVTVREMPARLVPRGAAVDVSEVVDKMTLVDLTAGEVLLQSRLESPTNVTRNVALTIPEGMVVIALPATDRLSRVGMLKPGDHVDLLFSLDTGQGGAGNLVTLAALQNLEIRAIVAPPTLEAVREARQRVEPVTGAPGREQAILVAVDPQDALIIKHMLDAGAIMDFALRAPNDQSAPFLEPVNLPFLMDTYGLDIDLQTPTAPASQSSGP